MSEHNIYYTSPRTGRVVEARPDRSFAQLDDAAVLRLLNSQAEQLAAAERLAKLIEPMASTLANPSMRRIADALAEFRNAGEEGHT